MNAFYPCAKYVTIMLIEKDREKHERSMLFNSMDSLMLKDWMFQIEIVTESEEAWKIGGERYRSEIGPLKSRVYCISARHTLRAGARTVKAMGQRLAK